MQKLQCELCGSVDIVRTDDGFFRCEHCGCKYTLEQAKAMLSTVETTIGTAELERLLRNAKAQYDIEQFDAAKSTYEEITKQFPDDYRGWLGLVQIYLRSYAGSSPQDVFVGHLIDWYKICLKLAPNENMAKEITHDWISFWDEVAQNCSSGKCEYCGTEFLELYADTSPAMYNYVKAGFDNAKILNSLNVVYSTERKQWVLRSKNDFEYYFWISTYIVKDFDDRTGYRNSQKWLPPIDDAYIAKIKSDIKKYIADMISKGKCPYCRGLLLKGIFGTKCLDCGRKF